MDKHDAIDRRTDKKMMDIYKLILMVAIIIMLMVIFLEMVWGVK